MAALLRFNFNRKGFQPMLDTLAETEDMFLRPLEHSRGVKMEKLMRTGVRKQFEAGGDPPWTPAHPFGTFQPASVTLGGASGRVAQAWEHARAEKGPREVRLRVTDKIALAHHRGATIRPRQDPSKMRFGVGLATGVWMSEERLQAGLVIPPRPVRFTDQMLLGAKLLVFAGFQAGD